MDEIAAQEALADSATTPTTLAQIAQQFPDLRSAVASHPAAYQGLIDWIAAAEAQNTQTHPTSADDPSQTEPQNVSAPEGANSAEEGESKPPTDMSSSASAPDEPQVDAATQSASKPSKARFTRHSTPSGESKKRHRLLFVAGIGLLLLALVVGGFVAGWITRNYDLSLQSGSDITPEVITVTLHPDEPTTLRMPDVRGLSKDEALQVIADQGWDPTKVILTKEPFAGEANVVVAQSPSSGVTNVGTIALTLSIPATVPDPSGLTLNDLTTRVRDLGANVRVVYAYDPLAAPGSILSVDPDVGKPLPSEVTVTVAESGTGIYVGQLKSVGGSMSVSKDLLLHGQSFTNSVTGRVQFDSRKPDDWAAWTYLLGVKANRFQAVFGIPDDVTDTGGAVHVIFKADGVTVGEFEAIYNAPVDVDLDVTGVNRFEIWVQLRNTPNGANLTTMFGLGDARVVGSATAMDELLQN
ncbi:MAG: PASTA domain-containing protein [Propionibacteriaceae bacterium]|jgi:hypothetical protein|nr:PASTA domain-containing protein [Propionibacteriaceae bacterium]